MTRIWKYAAIASLLLLGLSVDSVALAARPGAGMGPGHGGHIPLPASLEYLRTLTPDEKFERFRGVQVTILDQQGDPVVIVGTPATVSGVGESSVDAVANGQTTATSYRITSETVIHAGPARGTTSVLKNGDKVVVFTVADSSDALFIMKTGPHKGMGSGAATPSPAS